MVQGLISFKQCLCYKALQAFMTSLECHLTLDVVVLSIQSSPTLGDPMNQTSPRVSVVYHCVELS
jgi:hypothetical protein